MGEKAEKGNSLAPSSSMEPRTLVKLSNVRIICTQTDDVGYRAGGEPSYICTSFQ